MGSPWVKNKPCCGQIGEPILGFPSLDPSWTPIRLLYGQD
jgi:hypothetical protein